MVSTSSKFTNNNSQVNLAPISHYSWEYPGQQGAGSNTVSPDDSVNFLSFLQALRQQPRGKNITISVAVSLAPFMGSDGNPMSDVSDFAEVLDYIGEAYTKAYSYCILTVV